MAGVPAQTTQAQSGGVLGYGSKVFGTISVDASQVTYSFTGSSGDLVTTVADTWTGALDLQVDLIAPDGLQLSRSIQNMPGGDPMGAYLSVVLPDPGVYLLRSAAPTGRPAIFAHAVRPCRSHQHAAGLWAGRRREHSTKRAAAVLHV